MPELQDVAVDQSTMLATKGYAAQNPTSGLAAFNFDRRVPGPR